MSLALQVNSPELESNQAARGAVPCRPDGEEEDPSVLSDLTAMFPSMDQDVIVSVLQAHDGRIQGAVEYLMSAGEQELSRATLPLLLADLSVVDPARDMMGQFSEAIGGLPEVLPRFLYEEEGEEGESDDEENGLEREEERDRRRSFPTAPPQGGDDSDDDPLPTYDEACEESASQFPLIAQEDGSGSHAGAAARHISESETGVEPHVATTEPPAEDASAEVGTIKTPPSTDKKKKGGKKLHKIVSKLNPRKKGVARYKAFEKPGRDGPTTSSSPNHHTDQYQRLIDDEELLDEDL